MCGARAIRGLALSACGLVVMLVPVDAQQPDSLQIAEDSIELSETDSASSDSLATSNLTSDSVPSPGEPVVFAGDTLFLIHGSVGPFGPFERARAIEARLELLYQDTVEVADSVRVSSEDRELEITIGERVLMVVTPSDAAALGIPPDVLAAAWAETLQTSVGASLEQTGIREIVHGILWTLAALAALIGILHLMGRLFPLLYEIIRRKGQRLPGIRVQKLEILSTEAIVETLVRLARVVRTILTVLLIVVFTPLVLGLFAVTRGLSQQLTLWMLSPLVVVFRAIVGYLPNLFSIAVIVVVTWYGLKLVKIVFNGLDRGALHLPGFYQDWAAPTFQIVRVLIIVLTVILIWPYLPSSDSAAFQGVAAFLGLLLTFGSASAVANMVGGVVMIYMRPFQVGDRVRISDTVGDVVQKSLLVTRIRTIKRVEITIPNSMVLSSHIVNYSVTAAQDGILLHTSVTIGYDVPWRKVQQVMLSAARDVEGVLERPPPFVLQTALGDYAVTYELNAYTDRPGRMSVSYSRLHENLQDRFAEAGIEIMSPAYHAVRDGNASTVPEPEIESATGLDALKAKAEEARAKAALEEAAQAEEAVGEEAKAELARESAERSQALADAADAARRVLDTGRAALTDDDETDEGERGEDEEVRITE